jgi:protein-disulfide isomerase
MEEQPMSTTRTPGSSGKTRPSTSRREELRNRQQAAEKAAGRVNKAIRIAWVAGIAVIAVMLSVTIWSLVRPGGAGAQASGALVSPAGALDSGAVLIGKQDAKVTVSIYADFMCPYCGEFERANGTDLAAAVSADTAKLEIHPMSFLDKLSSGTEYSTRSANAFVTVANADPALAWAFDRLLYENQPAENSSGLTDAKLVELARQAGVPESVTATFSAKTYVPWVQKITNQAFDSGITGTPTVKINGQTFTGDVYSAGPLAAAIAQAAGA